MDLLLKFGVLPVCAAVIIIAVCRIDAMNVKDGSSYMWVASYILAAVFALGVALNLLTGQPVGWYELVGVAALFTGMWNHRHMWADDQAPIESQRSELRQADGSAL